MERINGMGGATGPQAIYPRLAAFGAHRERRGGGTIQRAILLQDSYQEPRNGRPA